MIKDPAIAINIQALVSDRSIDDPDVSMISDVYDGIRYITFTAMSNETFLESYSLLQKIADITNTDGRKETWANPHFVDDWEAIRPFMMNEINKDDRMPIVLSGCGIAGAIAVIAGYHLTMKHCNLQRVVTFGAPPALNAYKVKDPLLYPLQQITKQYILKNDPMPKLFRWTKYQNATRTALDFITNGSEIENYVSALKWMDL